MKVSFSWYHRGGTTGARSLAQKLSQSSTKQWRGWSWTDRQNMRNGRTQETLQVQVPTLRGARLHQLQYEVGELVGRDVDVLIEGRSPLNFAIWADDQIRRLQKISRS